MTKSKSEFLSFTRSTGREVIANFKGGSISSDGGILLLREIDNKLGLTKQVANILPDNRRQSSIIHNILTMLRQRVFGLAAGYEDLNDHNTLRNDIAIQTSVNSDKSLASSPTLCRFENSMPKELLFDMHKIFIQQFISSYELPPKELILDFDATDTILHGDQEGKFYHGYYNNYCFLPLHVFCNKQLLVSYQRTSNQDGAKHSWAILALLVKAFRKEWPEVQIIFRGDGGFCRHRMFDWCERNNVFYITGMPRNKVLERVLAPTMQSVQDAFESTNKKQREFISFEYQSASWSKARQIVGKAEYSEKGSNPRFVVSNMSGEADYLYDNIYCARGDMENDIKQIQLELFSDRMSCHKWNGNQFRLLLSSLAYILIERMRALCLKNTQLEKAQLGTIRLKLFKIGAVITKNTRKDKFLFSSHYPYQEMFTGILEKLVPI